MTPQIILDEAESRYPISRFKEKEQKIFIEGASWASLQTPSNEKYGWVKASERLPTKRHNYHVKMYSSIGDYCFNTACVFNERGQWEIDANHIRTQRVHEWLDESTPIPLTPCVELEKEVERLKGLIDLIWEGGRQYGMDELFCVQTGAMMEKPDLDKFKKENNL